jgi:hypothetical protein
MFTFKKLALVGVAGLAAFAMSCSDSDGDDPGGTWTTAFGATDSPAGVNLSGVITASGTGTVTALELKANDKNITVGTPPALNVGVVSLVGSTANGACSGLTGTQKITYKITVTFSEGDKLTGEAKDVSVDCGTAPAVGAGWTFTLSSGTGATDHSYADLDDNKTYGGTDALSASKIETIDLISLYNSDNKIFTPYAVGGFYTDPTDGSTFNGEDVVIWSIPSGDQTTAKALITAGGASLTTFAETYYEVAANELDPTEGVDIANGIIFVVETTEADVYAVTVTASSLSGAPRTVTLNAVQVK